MFNEIRLELDDDYNIVAVNEPNNIAVLVHYKGVRVAIAHFITDHVDVECITSISIDDEHINKLFDQRYTLGEVLVKFLIKFPTIVRKPEFRFICDVPGNLKPVIEKYHFNNRDNSNLENEILIRNQIVLPDPIEIPDGIEFKNSIEFNKIHNLLLLLRKNAYWQSHLTIERLNLLVKNSKCFFVTLNNEEIIGFARVLTDSTSFASLWDVVVDEAYRGKGIGTALMIQVFSDSILCKIQNWILFTDTAKKLYEKFGFISESNIPDHNLVHKLRLQDLHPSYMEELIPMIGDGLSIHLNAEQSLEFLYGDRGKRTRLLGFWKETTQVDAENEIYLNKRVLK